MSKLSLNTKIFVAFLTVALGMIVFGLFQSPGTADFRLHRARYEQIVAKAKAMGKGPEESGKRWVSSDLDPSSFGRKRRSNADMVGMIEVGRDEATGAYSVSITTVDRGHFGTFGYVYSDTANVFPRDINGELTSQSQIDPHWWIAENNSW